jgi:hypothetical protein
MESRLSLKQVIDAGENVPGNHISPLSELMLR